MLYQNPSPAGRTRLPTMASLAVAQIAKAKPLNSSAIGGDVC